MLARSVPNFFTVADAVQNEHLVGCRKGTEAPLRAGQSRGQASDSANSAECSASPLVCGLLVDSNVFSSIE